MAIKERLSGMKYKGVIFNFAQERMVEAKSRLHEFMGGPLAYMQNNQPIRKAFLLEFLDYFRPGIDTEHEHSIEKWRPRR